MEVEIMNELYISDSSIYFKTNANTYDKAMDEFLNACVNADIDIPANIKSIIMFSMLLMVGL